MVDVAIGTGTRFARRAGSRRGELLRVSRQMAVKGVAVIHASASIAILKPYLKWRGNLQHFRREVWRILTPLALNTGTGQVYRLSSLWTSWQ